MYPRNAASPERISIGPVVQISDGAVQTAGVTVRILPFGGSEADGVGTVAYSTDGVVVYTPTQAETNYTSFVLIAKKTGCIPADKTVVTSASATAGHAGTDQSKITNATSTVNLSGTTIKTATDIEADTQDIQSRLPSALVSGRMDSYLGATANNVITNNTIASNAIGNSQLATSAINAIQSGLATDTQATAIETDTQNIQSRLPTALVDGRMVSVAQVVSDKESYKLASDGLALVTAWTVDITGNLTGNVTGSVGSISGVTFPANFSGLGITVGGAIDQVISVSVVDELGQQALSANNLSDEIATAVAATQALSRLDSMIESDGAGQFRFDTIALEMAPAGGGGGGTDWNTNERSAFRTILGFNSSGDILDPSSGILDTIRDQTALITSGGTVYVSSPVTATGQLTSPLIIGDDYLAANGRRFRWTVALPSGYVIGTSTARFGMRYEDDEGVNSFVATGTVTDATGGNVHLDFDVAKTVTGTLRPGWYEWSVEIVSATGTEITRVKSGKNVEWQEKQT
jgi:hypothetical protein